MPKQIKLKDVVGGLEEVAECTVGGHTKDNCVKCAKAYANNSLLEKEVEIDEEAIKDLIFNAEDCPNCSNVGSFAQSTGIVDENGYNEWEQAQCEFCHTNPNSKYNIFKKIKDMLREGKIIKVRVEG